MMIYLTTKAYGPVWLNPSHIVAVVTDGGEGAMIFTTRLDLTLTTVEHPMKVLQRVNECQVPAVA